MLLNATMQEIEDFVCEFMGQNGTWVEIEKPRGDVRLLLFRLKYVEGGIEYYFDYGHATVSPWIDQKTQFLTKLRFPNIYEHADENLWKVEDWKEMFQGLFTELNAELLNRFGNTKDKPTEVIDPDTSRRREQVKTLSERNAPIDFIARQVHYSRSTVIRVRDKLGITKKRPKKKSKKRQ